jgi:hypothetical protein
MRAWREAVVREHMESENRHDVLHHPVTIGRAALRQLRRG